MGLWDDLGSGLKKVGSLGVDAVQATGDALVTEEAWQGVAQSLAAGEMPDGEDMMNVLLDASIAVPGLGVAGAATRLGAKTAGKFALKELTKEGAEAAAKKTALRNPLDRAVRETSGDAAKALKGQVESGLSKLVGKGGTTGARAGKHTGAAKPLGARMAAKKEAGIGTKVGFQQSGKRIAGGLALSGGLNALETNYDDLKKGLLGGDKPSGSTGPKGAPGAGKKVDTRGPGAGRVVSGGSSGGGGMSQERFNALLAEFMRQNGRIKSDQLTYQE